MNLQDVADFISLVKEPAKFEKALKDMQDEQERLAEAIATVGKASELDNLRKKLEKSTAKKVAELDEKLLLADVTAKQVAEQVLQLKQTLQTELTRTSRMQGEAEIEKKKYMELSSSFSGRDKALKVQESQVAELQLTLASSIREYEERLDKLRSVML